MTAPGCLSPDTCPVPDRIGRVRTVAVDTGTTFHNVYAHPWRHLLFNADGNSNARFSPLTYTDADPRRDDAGDHGGVTIGAVYLARHPVAALLETVFHDITVGSARIVSADADLAGRGLRTLTTPRRVLLADLRDPALERMGHTRNQITATTPAHYACTRQLADTIRTQRPGGQPLAGIMWNSRVTDIAATIARPTVSTLLVGPTSEICVLYNEIPSEDPLDDFEPIDTHPDLTTGTGRALTYDLADQLDAIII